MRVMNMYFFDSCVYVPMMVGTGNEVLLATMETDLASMFRPYLTTTSLLSPTTLRPPRGKSYRISVDPSTSQDCVPRPAKH
jgi:hypothetical protein